MIRIMNRLMIMIVCAAMAVGLAGCGGTSDEYYDDADSMQAGESVGESGVAAAMQAVIDIVGADAADYFFYDDGDMEVSLLLSGDLAVLVDDEGFDRIDCYCITMYDTERTDDNWYQPFARYYVPKTTGLVYLFDENTGDLIMKSDAGS
ncbi:MAG: hypothetical protein ACYCYM_14825 [Saccharofermentanales bacterium]